MVPGRSAGGGAAGVRASAAPPDNGAAAGEFADVLRARYAELNASQAAALPAAVHAADISNIVAGAGVCAALLETQDGAGERQAAAGGSRRFVQHEFKGGQH